MYIDNLRNPMSETLSNLTADELNETESFFGKLSTEYRLFSVLKRAY